MRIDLTFDFELERDAMETIVTALAPLFDCDVPRDRIALLVASPNAGARTSVRFWSEARRMGLAVASPELFPWCLANAPCGAIARHFGIRGPSYTFLDDAVASAIETAEDELEAGTVDVAVVVLLEARHLTALRLRNA